MQRIDDTYLYTPDSKAHSLDHIYSVNHVLFFLNKITRQAYREDDK